jgi:TRAP-type C4-dicarboxylate transport system permease small subunit
MAEGGRRPTEGTPVREGQRPAYLGPAKLPPPLRWLAHLSRWIALGEGAALGFLLAALVVLAAWQCVARNLHKDWFPMAPFKYHGSHLWVDSFIRHAVFLIGFLGGAFATHVVKHLRVDAVTRLLPVRARLAVRVIATLFAAGVCWMLLKAGLAFHADILANESGDIAQAAELVSRARGSMILPVGFTLILFHFVVQIILDLSWIMTGEDPPAEWLAEAHGGEIHTDETHEPLETATVLSEDL